LRGNPTPARRIPRGHEHALFEMTADCGLSQLCAFKR
jgi:hypothetical protein